MINLLQKQRKYGWNRLVMEWKILYRILIYGKIKWFSRKYVLKLKVGTQKMGLPTEWTQQNTN